MMICPEVGTLEGAREAMGKGEIDAWLWEKFTTKHLVDNGEPWRLAVGRMINEQWLLNPGWLMMIRDY